MQRFVLITSFTVSTTMYRCSRV